MDVDPADSGVVNPAKNEELVSRARAVGVAYEFAKPGKVESADECEKRRCRNQRKISKEERRLREAFGDLPPPPPPGSSHQEDEAYIAICAFEVEQMTHDFSCCEICKEWHLQCKTASRGNCCSRCKRDKHEPKIWSDDNNMDPGLVPEELLGLTDVEQILIARIAPAVHAEAWWHCD